MPHESVQSVSNYISSNRVDKNLSVSFQMKINEGAHQPRDTNSFLPILKLQYLQGQKCYLVLFWNA